MRQHEDKGAMERDKSKMVSRNITSTTCVESVAFLSDSSQEKVMEADN